LLYYFRPRVPLAAGNPVAEVETLAVAGILAEGETPVAVVGILAAAVVVGADNLAVVAEVDTQFVDQIVAVVHTVVAVQTAELVVPAAHTDYTVVGEPHSAELGLVRAEAEVVQTGCSSEVVVQTADSFAGQELEVLGLAVQEVQVLRSLP